MSKKTKDIKRALKYFNRGEYSQVIRLLESKIPLYLENKEFYYILAKAFYYTGDFSGSKLYFDRGQKIHWDVNSSLYLAVLGIKRRDYNSSLRIWLDILDEEPNNKIAKKGLDSLKKYSTMDELEVFIHSKKLDKLLPRKRIIIPPSLVVTIFFLLFIGISSIFIVKLDLVNKIFNPILDNRTFSSNGERDRLGQDGFNLNGLDNNFLDFSKESKYTFTGAQVEEFFKIGYTLFLDHKDNMVKTYLNLIKYSNANKIIKDKAAVLEGYLVEPNWGNYQDNITYKEVESNIFQYEGCIVKWKGSLTNLDIINRKIHFSLLVGYDNGKVLDGVVPVELNENIKIQENQPIEVFGRVTIRDNSFYLEALTVRQYIIKG